MQARASYLDDDPALARLGGAQGLEGATAHDAYDGRDPGERSQRTTRATYAMIGAQKIVMLLANEPIRGLK